MNVGFTVFTGDDMSAKHKPTTFALPVRMPRLKCSCREANEITHICAGCYELFCLKCYKEHRQQVLATLDYNADVNDTVFQAIYATSNQHDIVLRFNPIELRQHIYAFRDNMTSAANDSTRQALRSLRKLMDERNDKLIECIGPIKDVRTQKEAKSYVEQNWQRIIAELRAENDRIEHASNTSVRVSIHCAPATSWDRLIELERVKLNVPEGTFFGIGNPLLDLSIKVDERFLKKHNLKEGQILLAGPEHKQL
ncbi:unnamed protein product [Rotaria sp. Silwood1]|nr:unnamed protein product [Rotaria sp. Silwood1]CAF1617200.1 unnamed protein product [Rotaria sp. Silwood1]